MKKCILTIFLSFFLIGAGQKFHSPVEKGYVVPYQTMFMTVNNPLWVDRAAQAWCESDFNPKAVSEVGAKGLTQFMPATWKEWMGNADPFDPKSAIIGQDKYMRWLEARCNNNINAALGSYNAGLGNIRKAQFKANQLDLSGVDAWMMVYPSVQRNQAYVKQTLDYVNRNTQRRTIIYRMLETQKKT